MPSLALVDQGMEVQALQGEDSRGSHRCIALMKMEPTSGCKLLENFKVRSPKHLTGQIIRRYGVRKLVHFDFHIRAVTNRRSQVHGGLAICSGSLKSR